MAQTPAVVIIARHGPRLDAADQSWHLSTPTPYDPPLTYGGWNQSRALGVRIASLLEAREKQVNTPSSTPPSEASTVPVEKKTEDGFVSYDFGGGEKRKDTGSHDGAKRKKRKHRVVIHTSPFLRCVQTSVAIAAGMSQYQPTINATPGSQSTSSATARTPASLHSASPRLRAHEAASTSPSLAPIPEPKHDFAHEIARRVLEQKPQSHRAKLRVDAFLGEWLNPQYFEQITPPPPSAMMVATAKAELVQNESIEVYTPSISTKSSSSNLWGGSNGATATIPLRPVSRDGDDLAGIQEMPKSPKRERASSASSAGSAEDNNRHSPFRRGHLLHNNATGSHNAKVSDTAYIPPTPHYAVSTSDKIPRGYVGHARKACLDVDYQWDSSRPPQSWVDGGVYGEEWSAMHRRFRSGVNHLIQWYTHHSADERAEDSLGVDQAEKHPEEDVEEEEELVVIMVTHGAGCNALIGALTGQPVLLDVGMASLTMAVRREDAPPVSEVELTSPRATSPTQSRRGSFDLGLSAIYDMKLVSSSEHLRPDSEARRVSSTTIPGENTPSSRSALPMFREQHWNSADPSRSHVNSSLGSMRRPSTFTVAAERPAPHPRTESEPVSIAQTPSPVTSGLWTPPAARTPTLAAEKLKEERDNVFSKLNENAGRSSPVSATNGTKSKPGALSIALNGGFDGATRGRSPDEPVSPKETHSAGLFHSNGSTSQENLEKETAIQEVSGQNRKDSAPPTEVSEDLPQNLSRGLSQKGLWGTKPKGSRVERQWGEPKRRWSAAQKP